MLTHESLAMKLGISRPMVTRLVRRGMPLTSAKAAQAWREANLDPRLVKAIRRPHSAPAAPRKSKSGGNAAEFSDARLRREQADAQRAETGAALAAMLLKKRNGELVEWSSLRAANHECWRALRNRLQALPPRVAPRLVGLDPREATQLLAAEIDAVLTDFADGLTDETKRQ
jgi:hypothetical protein